MIWNLNILWDKFCAEFPHTDWAETAFPSRLKDSQPTATHSMGNRKCGARNKHNSALIAEQIWRRLQFVCFFVYRIIPQLGAEETARSIGGWQSAGYGILQVSSSYSHKRPRGGGRVRFLGGYPEPSLWINTDFVQVRGGQLRGRGAGCGEIQYVQCYGWETSTTIIVEAIRQELHG